MTEKTKEVRISDELKRVTVFFENVDENHRAIVKPMLQNAAFMKVTLEDLQEKINAEGTTDGYQNGANQWGTKQSATLQAYNALMKNYTTVIKTLSSLLPKKQNESVDEFRKWMDEILEDESPEKKSPVKKKPVAEYAVQNLDHVEKRKS